MTDEQTACQTPIHNRQVSHFRYQRTPSALMPTPCLPERILLPTPDIHRLFALRIACDDGTEAQAFAVRWQVYCQELGYEPAERFPDHRERDTADLRSVQVIANYRPTGLPVACFRLMLADPMHPRALFHVEQVCSSLTARAIPADGDARRGCAELSRFCITSAFRRFDADTETPPWGIPPVQWAAESRQRRGLAGLMWLAAAHIAVELRLDYLLTLMEPRLELLGRTMGLAFQAIGTPVDFRGLRVPYRIDRRSLRSLLGRPQAAGLLQPLVRSLDEGMRSHPLLQPYLDARTRRIDRSP
ncbi:MAG: PEP-CTERM/exosortase system-associated acyltransferase [Planctomycetes bacterium]|nr:PEP-CTERM/exosortase system-associated acyltransferase [Planctomycetota bacterium]